MKRASLLCCCLMLVGCTKPPAEDPTKPFQGDWAFVENGKKTDKTANFNHDRFTIFDVKKKGDETRIDVTELDHPVFQVDVSQTPNHITLVYLEKDGAERKGIFELDGAKLKICLAELDEPRPTTFAAGDKTTLMLLERVSDP